jgi:hypothetical protein
MVQNQNNIEKLLTSKAVRSICLVVFGSFKPRALNALVFAVVKNKQILSDIAAKCKKQAKDFVKHEDKIRAFLQLNKDECKDLCLAHKSLITYDSLKTMPLQQMVVLCLLIFAAEHDWEDESDNQDESRYFDYEMDFENLDDFLTWLEVVELSEEAKQKDNNEGADHEDLDDLEDYKNPFGDNDISEETEIEDLDLDFEIDLTLCDDYEAKDLGQLQEQDVTQDLTDEVDATTQQANKVADLQENLDTEPAITDMEDDLAKDDEVLQDKEPQEEQEEEVTLTLEYNDDLDDGINSNFESFMESLTESLSQLTDDDKDNATYYNINQNHASGYASKNSRASLSYANFA